MHELLDTEEFDAAGEHCWPEGFKEVLREKLGPAVQSKLEAEKTFVSLYERLYRSRVSTYQDFTARLAELVVIGAENGTDYRFDELHAAFRAKRPLPPRRQYARSLLPGAFDRALEEGVKAAVIAEYAKEHAYSHAFEHYAHIYSGFPAFIQSVACLVADGAVKGSEEMLTSIYRSLFFGLTLPPGRRHPKRLKKW